MPVTKEMFDEQYKKALKRYSQLKDMGKTEPEIEETMAKEKYSAPVLSKLFHKSGKRITKKVMAADVKLAEQTLPNGRTAGNLSGRKRLRMPLGSIILSTT